MFRKEMIAFQASIECTQTAGIETGRMESPGTKDQKQQVSRYFRYLLYGPSTTCSSYCTVNIQVCLSTPALSIPVNLSNKQYWTSSFSGL